MKKNKRFIEYVTHENEVRTIEREETAGEAIVCGLVALFVCVLLGLLIYII